MERQFQVGQKLLLAFHGRQQLSPEIISAIRQYRPAGMTLFRSLNVGTPAQLKQLTGELQRLAQELEISPFIIAADQEGGQLMAVGAATPLPGNMALGATRSPRLARSAGEVLGRELAALGINVDYAPCVDVNTNPHNPVVGTRSFGEEPLLVSELAAALVAGLQSQGVAATAKHFPGHGDVTLDSHHGLAGVPHSPERLRSVELPPFRAAISAGVKLVMTAHLGILSIDGPQAPPATLSPNVVNGLLRRELGFDGVVVSDAMDMRAIRQGEPLREEVVRAAAAGVDLLLMTSDPQDQRRAFEALQQAAGAGRLSAEELGGSLARIARLKAWLAAAPPAPGLSVIRCAGHLQVADEIAERSVTLVRDACGRLPLRLAPGQRIAVVVPTPRNLTPADTSSYEIPQLAGALRRCHPQVDEFRVPFQPSGEERQALLDKMQGYDLVVAGTINAYAQPEQAELVRGLLQAGPPVVVIALRLPYDLAAFPEAPVYLCTYSLLEPSMRAAARVLFGLIEPTGRLPVSLPGFPSA